MTGSNDLPFASVTGNSELATMGHCSYNRRPACAGTARTHNIEQHAEEQSLIPLAVQLSSADSTCSPAQLHAFVEFVVRSECDCLDCLPHLIALSMWGGCCGAGSKVALLPSLSSCRWRNPSPDRCTNVSCGRADGISWWTRPKPGQ